jgi:hypothetical protein
MAKRKHAKFKGIAISNLGGIEIITFLMQQDVARYVVLRIPPLVHL